jgi:hypothetical protein
MNIIILINLFFLQVTKSYHLAPFEKYMQYSKSSTNLFELQATPRLLFYCVLANPVNQQIFLFESMLLSRLL